MGQPILLRVAAGEEHSVQEVFIELWSHAGRFEPAAFALTLEQTGGVVFPAGPLLVVASVES